MDDKKAIPWPIWDDSFDINDKTGKTGELYTDPQLVLLPPTLEPLTWKRFHEMDNVEPILYDSTNSPDLFSNNGHLFKSQFMKWYCSVLTILNYNHVSEERRWQGWHHIKNSQINPNGKYIIRLFYMGSWRHFEVDDTVPFNEDNIPLLPRTQNLNELWPMLLAKATLKIASLTPMANNEIADLNPFLCFTGWPWLPCNTTHLSPKERWKFLTKYTEKCTEPKSVEMPMKNNVDSNEKSDISTGRRKSSRKNDNDSVERQSQVKSDFPIVTLLYIHDTENDKVPKIPPTYPVCVESTCDVPADPTQIKPPLEGWKLYRWISWAAHKGIINPTEYFAPVRRLLLFNPLKISEPRAQWVDFNELNNRIMDIFLIFKSTYFKFSADITNVIELKQEKTESVEKNDGKRISETKKNGLKKNENGGRKKKNNKNLSENGDNVKEARKNSKRKSQEKKSSSQNSIEQNYSFLFHPEKITKNEPIYLFTDSLDSKLLLFTFQVYGGNVTNSLIIQRYHVFGINSSNDNDLMMIETKNVTSQILCLDPGRHVLKIFCQAINLYYLTISSNTAFIVGNREKIHEAMISESELTKALAMEVKSKLAEAFDAFGSSNYPIQLKNFYKSYLPPETTLKMNKSHTANIHQTFKDEFIKIIREKCPEEMYINLESALKIFFMDPYIGINSSDRQNYEIDKNSIKANENSTKFLNFHDSERILLVNIAATIVQSFFKMVEVRSLREKHRSTHKDYEQLRESYSGILSLLTEQSMCNLMRNIITNKDNVMWKKDYPCSSDFEYTINVQKIIGQMSIIDNEWIHIVRKNLFVPKDTVVLAMFDLSSDLSDYILRVFNNDSGKEIERIINNVIPHNYRENNNGYTVLGYARNSKNTVKNPKWTLNIITQRTSPQFTLDNNKTFSTIEHEVSMIHEISNIYIPNIHNNIAKIILKLSKSCSLSLRFGTSYRETKIKLKMIDDRGRIFKETAGNSVVLLPVLTLEGDGREYYINVFVCENSWPLTADEWQYVERVRGKIDNVILQMEESKMSDVAFDKVVDGELREPYWKLQVICESDIGIELKEDQRRTMEILHLKKQWISKDTDRISLGKELREKFRQENCINNDDEESIKSIISLIDETRRMLYPPDNEMQNLPPINSVTLFEYLEKFDSPSNSSRQNDKNNLYLFERQLERITRHSLMLMASTI